MTLNDIYVRYVLVSDAFAKRFRVRSLEWFLALAMLLVGLELLRPTDTFDLLPYIYLRRLATETAWAWTCTAIGTARLLLLAINGALPRGSPHLRAALSATSMLVWGSLAAGYAAARFPTLMLAFTIPATAFEFVNIYRAGGDASVEDKEPSRGVD